MNAIENAAQSNQGLRGKRNRPDPEAGRKAVEIANAEQAAGSAYLSGAGGDHVNRVVRLQVEADAIIDGDRRAQRAAPEGSAAASRLSRSPASSSAPPTARQQAEEITGQDRAAAWHRSWQIEGAITSRRARRSVATPPQARLLESPGRGDWSGAASGATATSRWTRTSPTTRSRRRCCSGGRRAVRRGSDRVG